MNVSRDTFQETSTHSSRTQRTDRKKHFANIISKGNTISVASGGNKREDSSARFVQFVYNGFTLYLAISRLCLSNASQPKISQISFCSAFQSIADVQKNNFMKKKRKRRGRKWDHGLFLDNPFNCAFH